MESILSQKVKSIGKLSNFPLFLIYKIIYIPTHTHINIYILYIDVSNGRINSARIIFLLGCAN